MAREAKKNRWQYEFHECAAAGCDTTIHRSRQFCREHKREGSDQMTAATKEKAKRGRKPKAEAAEKKTKVIPEPRGTPKDKKVSALDAAATVLKDAGEAMDCQTMIAKMADRGLWTSPGGKTPHATLYSAILRELKTKGNESRFKKVERGKFEYVNGE